MAYLTLHLVLMCVLTIDFGFANSCGDHQRVISGQCCNLCQPGQYAKDMCTKDKQTVCLPCPWGSFANRPNALDKCEKCQVCNQEYTKNCTSTTDARCSCRAGFLCSDSTCSKCVENTCVKGEITTRTSTSYAHVTVYAYRCEPLCPDVNTYFDEKGNTCKPRIQCAVLGLAELFPGNKTHNSICQPLDMQRGEQKAGDSFHVILSAGIVFLSLSICMVFSFACVKKIIKPKATNNEKSPSERHPDGPVSASSHSTDFHLSKEESGLQLIIQDGFKTKDDVKVHLEQTALAYQYLKQNMEESI